MDNALRGRWFQFSLRSLLGALFAAAIAALVLSKWLRIEYQRRTVDFVVQQRGEVVYDWQMHPAGGRRTHPKLPGAPWLRECTGNDFFQSVVEVTLVETCTDRDIERLACLPRLHALYLFGDAFTDDAVGSLSRLPYLKTLGLFGTRVTHDGERRMRLLRPSCSVHRYDMEENYE